MPPSFSSYRGMSKGQISRTSLKSPGDIFTAGLKKTARVFASWRIAPFAFRSAAIFAEADRDSACIGRGRSTSSVLPAVGRFAESHQFKGGGRKIRRVLVGSPLDRFRSRVLIPLFAGGLTSPASRALGRIDEKGFAWHVGYLPCLSWLFRRLRCRLSASLLMLTMKAFDSGISVLGSPRKGIRRLALSPPLPSAGNCHPKCHGIPTMMDRGVHDLERPEPIRHDRRRRRAAPGRMSPLPFRRS